MSSWCCTELGLLRLLRFWQGLEVIEAHYLFGASYDNIDIVIHPQSIIHSMVETADSSVIGQVRTILSYVSKCLVYVKIERQQATCSLVSWFKLR